MKPKKANGARWVNVGDGVQIYGGCRSRRRFQQAPQGKSGPAIRRKPDEKDMPEAGESEGGRHTPPTEGSV